MRRTDLTPTLRAPKQSPTVIQPTTKHPPQAILNGMVEHWPFMQLRVDPETARTSFPKFIVEGWAGWTTRFKTTTTSLTKARDIAERMARVAVYEHSRPYPSATPDIGGPIKSSENTY